MAEVRGCRSCRYCQRRASWHAHLGTPVTTDSGHTSFILKLNFRKRTADRLFRGHGPFAPWCIMERVSETWVTVPKRPSAPANKDGFLVHIYPTGPTMGSRYSL